DQVLGVVLHDRIDIGLDGSAGAFERAPQLLDLLLPAFHPRRHQHVDGDAAGGGGGELAKDRLVVAAEQGQRDPAARAPNDVEDRRAPLVDGGDQLVGRTSGSGHTRARRGCWDEWTRTVTSALVSSNGGAARRRLVFGLSLRADADVTNQAVHEAARMP